MTIQTQESERRSRHNAARSWPPSRRRGRRRTSAADSRPSVSSPLDGVQVSARATDLATGAVLFSVDDHVVMPTASIGKVLLLVEVAARLRAGS